MTKKQSLISFTIFDLFVLGGMIMFYYDFSKIVQEISNQVEVISLGSRMGFFIVGMIAPICHVVGIIEYFRPEYIKKNLKILNISAIAVLVALFAAGFAGSAWIRSKVENAGYVYCRKASGASALSKTLVYTKNMDICEELVASKKDKR